MLIRDVALWIDKFKNAWLFKDLSKFRDLFQHTQEYSKGPDHTPLTQTDDILKMWREDIINQSIHSLTVYALSIDGNMATVYWQIFYKDKRDHSPYAYHGIYLIYFDDKMNAVSFKQWLMQGDPAQTKFKEGEK